MANAEFDFEAVREALAREIEASGKAPTNISQAVRPSNKSLVKNIIDEGRDIKLSTLTQLANALGINIARLIPWAVQSPQPYFPRPETLATLIRPALPALSAAPEKEDVLLAASHEISGALEYLAAFPEREGSEETMQTLANGIALRFGARIRDKAQSA